MTTPSDVSEAEYEYGDDLDGSAVHPINGLEPGLWRVRDGAILEISKMATEHITNAVNVLLRAGLTEEHPKIQEFRQELRKR